MIIGWLVTGCSGGVEEAGTLRGRVTIGPISPVERVGEETVVPPEAYAARKVMVYYYSPVEKEEEGAVFPPDAYKAKQLLAFDKGSSKLVKQVDLGQDGYYSAQLKPGLYTVDINHIGIDSSRDVPQKVEIKTGETVVLNIDVDTGIR